MQLLYKIINLLTLGLLYDDGKASAQRIMSLALSVVVALYLIAGSNIKLGLLVLLCELVSQFYFRYFTVSISGHKSIELPIQKQGMNMLLLIGSALVWVVYINLNLFFGEPEVGHTKILLPSASELGILFLTLVFCYVFIKEIKWDL